MSSTLRVELPAYSHSFQVQLTSSSTIRDVKHEIAKICPGSPSPDGQRLVWKGRFLRDEENVEDVWKSPEDSRVVHLAVHPSAWSSAPPPLPSATAPGSTQSSPLNSTTRLRTSAGQPASVHTSWQQYLPYPSLFPSPVTYIRYIHHVALAILSSGSVTLPTIPTLHDLELWRSAAKDLYRAQGWVWPDVYEQPFPSGTSHIGVKYDTVTLEGLPYLQLADPNVEPTPAQLHALRVISHTFPILSMANDSMLYNPSSVHYPSPYSATTNVNPHLHHLGFPQLRIAHAQGANPNPPHDANNPARVPGADLGAIPVRALLMPLLMLAFRTLLMLYFFSPSKRPLFGLLLSLWILYEAWNAMRLVLNDGINRAAGDPPNPGPFNVGAGGADQPARPVEGAGPNVAAPDNNGAGTSGAVLNWLSTHALAAEEAILNTDAPVPEPGLVHKTRVFLTLFFVTLWPSAWDVRRNVLRRREGRIRTEANIREVALQEREQVANPTASHQDGEQQRQQRSEEDLARARQLIARHDRRPAWLKQYVQRVQYTEWVDDP